MSGNGNVSAARIRTGGAMGGAKSARTAVKASEPVTTNTSASTGERTPIKLHLGSHEDWLEREDLVVNGSKPYSEIRTQYVRLGNYAASISKEIRKLLSRSPSKNSEARFRELQEVRQRVWEIQGKVADIIRNHPDNQP